MDYFVEQAPSDYEVQALIRKKYGDRARILARKEIRTGGILGLFKRRAIEVTGYCTHAPQPRTTQRRDDSEERKRIIAAALGESGEKRPDAAATATSPAKASGADTAREPATSRETGGDALALTNSRSRTEPPVDLDTVLSEIRSMREQFTGAGDRADEPEAVQRIREILEENDFSRRYVDETIETLRRECTFDQLTDEDYVAERVVERIENSIEVYPWKEGRRRPHVFVLVGPTGVGKTTTIAKLAAMYGAVADPGYDVRILTIDTYRIGALQQIEKYGEIMSIPVHAVETVDDMEKQLALNHDADFIFVDTIGKSPNDFAKLADVNRLVRSAGGEVHLAVSATTKRSDIVDILRHFEPFHYQAVVVTKLDETSSVGGVISALAERRQSVSFVTDGQSVPQDIERARRHTFLRRLRELPVQRRDAETVYKE
ncbi:MAG: flagellar biosynthesis protein FlhF [Alkalispirochaeta sp.]